MMGAAETAFIQGVDLYGAERSRLEATLEFHAKYLLGAPPPSAVCGGSVSLDQHPTFEIAYNAFHNHLMVFETLTHGAAAP